MLLKQKHIQIQSKLQGTHSRELKGGQNTKPKPNKRNTENVQ